MRQGRTRKTVSALVVAALLCVLFVTPVMAAEPVDYGNGGVVTATTGGSTYYSGSTTKLNSVYGSTASSTLTVGSTLGDTRSITKVEVYCNVSSGSSAFKLTVKSPYSSAYTTCSTSNATYTFTSFNGEDPKGTWTVSVASEGTVSTVTCTLKVYYTYSY